MPTIRLFSHSIHILVLLLCLAPLCAGEVPKPRDPNTPVPEDQKRDLPRGKLEEGVFVKSGEIKIAYADVEKIVNLFLINERKRDPKYMPSFDTLLRSRLEIAEVLLRNAILQKYAKENNLAASKEQVDAFISTQKKALEKANRSYEQWLADTGMTDEEFRRFQAAKIPIEQKAGAQITDKDVEAKFNELKDTTPLRSVAHVLFQYKGADGAPKTLARSKEEARKLAEAALEQAKTGKDFSEIAKQSDDEASRGNGGQYDFFPLKGQGAMVEEFGKASYAIPKVGGLSPVVETPYGFHVIKLTGIRDEEFKAQVRAYLANQKFHAMTDPIIVDALDKAVFSEDLTRPKPQ